MRPSAVALLLLLLSTVGPRVSAADSDPTPLTQQTAIREDTSSRSLRLSMQVVKVRFAADGTWEMSTVSTPMAMAMLAQKASLATDSRDQDGVTFHHLGIEITVTRNGAEASESKADISTRMLDIKGTFNVVERADHFQSELAIQGRVLPGKKLIVGLTDNGDPQVRAAVATGRFPAHVKSAMTVYYLHITPTLIAEPSTK